MVAMAPFRCPVQMTVSKWREGHFHSRNDRPAEWDHRSQIGPTSKIEMVQAPLTESALSSDDVRRHDHIANISYRIILKKRECLRSSKHPS